MGATRERRWADRAKERTLRDMDVHEGVETIICHNTGVAEQYEIVKVWSRMQSEVVTYYTTRRYIPTNILNMLMLR